MTDNELLTLAAKAAGIELAVDMTGWLPVQHAFHADGTHQLKWNPLTDDGDALRLAVKLGVSFRGDYTYPDGVHVVCVSCTFNNTLYGDQEICGDDPYAATRRAIVRAAAEIAKEMK